MTELTMYRLLQSYLAKLPGTMKQTLDREGDPREQCIYTPHSLRATAATLLRNAGVDITAVQELLGHKDVKVTQGYDKTRRSVTESASHLVPL